MPAQLLKSAYWSLNPVEIIHYTGETKPWSWHLQEKSNWKSAPSDEVLSLWYEFINPYPKCEKLKLKRKEGITCVITTYSRPIDYVQDVINSVETIQAVSAIRIKNLNPHRTINGVDFTTPKEIHIDHYTSDSLNNRFDVQGIETEAVLYLDDDIIASPKDLTFLIRSWQDHKNKLTGFFSRSHLGTEYSFNTRSEYSMILTKAMVVHIDYVYKYDCLLLPELKEYVDTHMNCEDILMNFLVASVSSEGPAFVAARPILDRGRGSGLSVKHGKTNTLFNSTRSNCVNFFSAQFGRNPLKYSSNYVSRGLVPKTIITTDAV